MLWLTDEYRLAMSYKVSAQEPERMRRTSGALGMCLERIAEVA
jgi:hypothetical protein